MKCVPLLCLIAGALSAQSLRMTTSQYDNMRSGANVNEAILTPKNVNVRNFGKLLSLPVDGDVYAQPLYLSDVNVPGKGVRNLLFVATEHDSVYAFDADSNLTAPIWHATLLSSNGTETTVSDSDVRCPFISPEVGITSTPVIDAGTGTIYVLTRTKRTKNMFIIGYVQQLHALAITTGKEKLGGPVEIQAAVTGRGVGSSGGEVRFDPLRENPRAALLLSQGAVFLTWASSCDVSPYHGWVMAYDAKTLRQLAVFNTSPNAGESGIWQSDTGPAADSQGNVYVSTGNGLFDAKSRDGLDYGDTVLKLRFQANKLVVSDYFTPYDQEELNSTDGDLGSGGPLLITNKSDNHATALVFGGKAGVLYAIDPDRMGGRQTNSHDPSIESFRLSKGIYSAPAYWNGNLYYYADGDSLKQFAMTNGKLSSTPSFQSNRRSKFSGGTPTVSANGTQNGIVWLVETRAWNAGGTRAVLRAYDALNVGSELYSSNENPGRDQAGIALRFTIPTVANGRVYIGGAKSISVYGLLPHR